MGIYNLNFLHCEYVTVDALLCGHLSLTGMIQTAVINSVFVDLAASDSQHFIINIAIQVNTSNMNDE